LRERAADRYYEVSLIQTGRGGEPLRSEGSDMEAEHRIACSIRDGQWEGRWEVRAERSNIIEL